MGIVRRGIIILVLCIALLIASGASLVVVPQINISRAGGSIRLDRLACIVCILFSALLGLLGMFSVRIACSRLTKSVRELTLNGRGTLLDVPHTDLSKLTYAIND